MSWQTVIAGSGSSATWLAVCQYADERIAALTRTCLSEMATVEQIRSAQAGIAELQRLRDLPASLQQDAWARST